MRTKFDVRDVQSLCVTKRKDEDKGIVYDYTLKLEMFPETEVPIDSDEYMRLARSFSRNLKRGTLIEA